MGENSMQVAAGLNNLGALHIARKDYACAEVELKRAMAIATKTQGADSSIAAIARDYLVDVYRATDREHEAPGLGTQVERTTPPDR